MALTWLLMWRLMWQETQSSWSAQDVTLTAMTAEPGAQPSTASAAAGCPITSLSTPAATRLSSFTLLAPRQAALSPSLSLSSRTALITPASHMPGVSARLQGLACRLGQSDRNDRGPGLFYRIALVQQALHFLHGACAQSLDG